MSLIYLVGVLIVVGFGLWLVNQYIPMEARIKTVLNVVVLVVVVLWLLNVFGIMGSISHVRVGK
jgi:hypothetical protein